MNIIKVVIVSAAAMLMSACGTSPEAEAEAFVQALHSGDAEEAVAHVDPRLSEAWRPKLLASVHKTYQKGQRRGGLSAVEILKSEINGETASVTIQQNFEDGSQANINVKLQEIDGDWFVTF